MRTPLFLAKFSKYEYWPWWLFYLPVLPYWLYLAVKNKSLAYFTAANPGIELGGFYGESKTEILELIDPAYLPRAVSVNNSHDLTLALAQMETLGLFYPIIAKPDVGERGNAVKLIRNEQELMQYHAQAQSKYLLQEYIEYTIELGVLYSRMPGAEKGKVSSVTLKEFLTVKGDGSSKLRALMNKNLRARFQIARLSKEFGDKMNDIPEAGELRLLEPIGNHCRGTKFINNNFLINEELNQVFDKISIPIKGFYYGRFDLKVKSISDLYRGENIRILELNGASSEPGHIYDPSLTLYAAYKDLLYHWRRLAEIAQGNIKSGFKPASFLTIARSYWKYVVLKGSEKKTAA